MQADHEGRIRPPSAMPGGDRRAGARVTERHHGPGEPTARYECVVVGGGLAGVHLGARLCEETPIAPGSLCIVDPGERLTAAFRAKARRCGMRSMRSSYLDHVGVHPMGLELFAVRTDRADELHETEDYPPRPSLSLFLDHVDDVIDRYSLARRHRRGRVTGLHERHSGVVVETDRTSLYADRCVLAVGPGTQHTHPTWTTDVDEGAVTHVFDQSFDPGSVAGHAVVVGGGVTAVQTARELADRGVEVTLLARDGLDERTIEADVGWQRWSHLESTLHTLPPGSRERMDRVTAARHDGTVPPYLVDELQSRVASGAVTLVHGEAIGTRSNTDSSIDLLLSGGGTVSADAVVLATGFDAPFTGPLIEATAGALGLERGAYGEPVLDDRSLAWRRVDGGEASPVHVVGAPAAGAVGPFAGNIVGARMAAERIVDTWDDTAELRVGDNHLARA